MDRPLSFARGYLLTAPLALLAIWGHHYPVGVDLPQHANLVRLWVELAVGPAEYGALYKISPFTPYALPYALAYPLARWGSTLVAIKVLLSLSTLSTPWALARWLRAVGGEPVLGLLGFPIVFGFAYLWGFLANTVSLPLLFLYLAAVERLAAPRNDDGPRVSLRDRDIFLRACAATGWGVLLFFGHGITFGVAALSGALRLLVARFRGGSLWRLLHLAPLFVLTVVWLALRETAKVDAPNWWLVSWDRFLTLFSGLFWPQASTAFAGVTAFALVLLLAVGRPAMNRSPGAWIPFVIALLSFLVLPDYVLSVYLVGTRFSIYVQAFALALWASQASHARARGTALVVVALAMASLVFLNVRLSRWNAELDGFRELCLKIPDGADVQTFLHQQGGGSAVFGPREVAQVPAWVAAEKGGLIENDSAMYAQMPVQRRPRRFPTRYRYLFARGDEHTARVQVAHAFPDASLVGQAGGWFLFERQPLVTGAFTVVRSAQEAGELHVDHSMTGSSLVVAGVAFARGLGTHARSFLRIHGAGDKATLEGGCGIDDAAPPDAALTCRIVDPNGGTLWTSGPMTRGTPVKRFSVPLDAHHEALLLTAADAASAGNFADWVLLR